MEVDLDLSTSGRSIDVALNSNEVITIDLESLDQNPDELLSLLTDGTCKVSVWTQLASEYWRRGWLTGADKIAREAIEHFKATGSTASLPTIYALLANIQLAHARLAPKIILEDARQDKMLERRTKDFYQKEVAVLLNQASAAAQESGHPADSTLTYLTRAIFQLSNISQSSVEGAFRDFEGVLQQRPTNLVALMGKARILYARRSHREALAIFQKVLSLNPETIPDPRIGIGLCFWALGNTERAKAAWTRSLKIACNPNQWPAELLLGIEALNASKDSSNSGSFRTEAYASGTRRVQKAFQANTMCAAAANALSDFFLRRGDYIKAMKLAERTIQCADTRAILAGGYIRAARVAHAEGHSDSRKHYQTAMETLPSVLPTIGIAQMQMLAAEIPAAIHTLDTCINNGPPVPPEALIMLASLRANPRPGLSSTDLTQEKLKARSLFDRIIKEISLPESSSAAMEVLHQKTLRDLGEDIDMQLEIARLWQDENIERTTRAVKDALRIARVAALDGGSIVDPRLLNNLGALMHIDGDLVGSRTLYEEALTSASAASASGDEAAEATSTSVLYNLARVYEDQAAPDLAKEVYEKLLTRHPEYVDAKIRLAHLLCAMNRTNEAHDLLKQALTSQNQNLNLRAYYTYFLLQSGMPKPAKDFVFNTLKDHGKHDVYSFCAAGWLMYHFARESRDTTPEGIRERKKGFQRAAEFYEKALQIDNMSAVAAQGLAIVVAEDALGSMTAPPGSIQPAEDALVRAKNSRDALEVFAKVRESLSDGSVYANMGHCYYARDEYERAIESYETASRRYFDGQNVPVLLYLSRAWYAKANKDQSFPAMRTALKYAQSALHLQPNDKSIVYNIAMIQQKAAEMLFSLPPAKRTLVDLQKVIENAVHAQLLFGSLAEDKTPILAYNRDMADQRRKYGESLLRKGPEHLATQEKYEADAKARIESARQKRQEDKDRLDALEAKRQEELKIQAEELAEARRKAREETLSWASLTKIESDEERPRARRKKEKKPDGSGDEGSLPKRRRLTKRKSAAGADDDGGLFTGDEDGDSKPKKRIPKKRMIKDEDDDNQASQPHRKKIKSEEYVDVSDED